MTSTIELFTTTIDAVGMDTQLSRGAVVFYLWLLSLFTLFFLGFVIVLGCNRNFTRKRAAVSGVIGVVLVGLWAYFALTPDSYIENPWSRLTRTPAVGVGGGALLSSTQPGPDGNNITVVIHDQFQDELARHDELQLYGLDEQCQTQREASEYAPAEESVLCGGYALTPVVTNGWKITPSIMAEDDLMPNNAFTVDPYAMEVTARITIKPA